MKKKGIISVWILFAALVLTSFVRAGRLPVRAYTTADGLANDTVNKIVRDSRGFLWFCTSEGLSRFDGFEFKNYGQNEGLPHRNINDFLETKNGEFLVATNNGLVIFNPNGKAFRWNLLTSSLEQTSNDPPMFRVFQTPNSNVEKMQKPFISLTKDRDGRMFAGTAKGLFRVEIIGSGLKFYQIESDQFEERTVFSTIKFDAAGFLWIVASSGIYRLSPAGEIENFRQDGGGSLLIDKSGRIWVGSSGLKSGLRVFTVSPDGQTAQLTKTFHKSDGLPEERPISDIIQIADGRIFAIIESHLCEILETENSTNFRIVEDGAFSSLAEDAGGNLWLGTEQQGTWKVALGGFVKYDQSDGVPVENISSMGVDAGGNIFFTDGKQNLTLFNGETFETVQPFGLTIRNWGKNYLDFQSSLEEWWIPAIDGLRRYPKTKNFNDLAKTAPQKIYTTADGLYGDQIFNIFEDSREDIWISLLGSGIGLQLWDSKTGEIHRFTAADGLPETNGAVAFGEDTDKNVWLGFFAGGLARYRNGKFKFFNAEDDVSVGTTNAFLSDKTGRLWISTASRGIFRVDNPTAENPTFTNISTAEGMSSNQANCLVEDNFGYIYVGTGRGVNRIDPLTGNIKLFTQSDGLPGSVVQYCVRDKTSSLWFISQNTPVKFVPQAEQILKPLPVFIGAISVNGINQPISELGAETVENLDLNSEQHQIRIDFFALGFNAGDRIRYQYKLGDEDWHEPEDAKSVNFNLASGDYNFYVRAVNADGVTSENPAAVSFKIAAPFWRRWWFLLLAALFVVGIILTIERTRAARLRALKSAFGKLSVSENRFRQMNEQSPLGIVIFAPDGSIRAVNRAYENFWGIRFEQIKNWDFMADEQIIKTGVAAKLRRVFSGETVTLPPSAYNPQTNGAGVKVDETAAPHWIQSFAYPVKNDDGELLEVILVMEDVTDRKRADEILENARSERLRELEQVRRRIAADLHDDIGSSLTQISIWSEVLQRDIRKQNGNIVSEPLTLIGNSSRELVDAMSDIVWAINPQKDFLSELSGKMRRFASDVFTARNIEFTFDAPHFAEEFALGANLRREVFLIFKEAVNNIVKHAKSTKVIIELSVENSKICLLLRDNGAGFDSSENSPDGHGILNMKARANGLGGTLEIVSNRADGTTITLVAPLGADEKSLSIKQSH